MENSRINLEMLICDSILNMDRPFKISQLLNIMEAKGVNNKQLVLDILDQLCDSGLIKYSEIEDDIWAYKKSSTLVCLK